MDAGSHSDHILVIRCDIKLGSAGKSRDVEDRTVSEKIQWASFRHQFSKTAFFF
jgi:hypothetical protein